MASRRKANKGAASPLHPLEFQILLALVQGPTHAYAIVQTIEALNRDQRPIQPTNLYRRIWRLATDGLLEQVPPPTQSTRRKYVALTALGLQVAKDEAVRLQGLLDQAADAGIFTAEAHP